jgi:hypothetical protein
MLPTACRTIPHCVRPLKSRSFDHAKGFVCVYSCFFQLQTSIAPSSLEQGLSIAAVVPSWCPGISVFRKSGYSCRSPKIPQECAPTPNNLGVQNLTNYNWGHPTCYPISCRDLSGRSQETSIVLKGEFAAGVHFQYLSPHLRSKRLNSCTFTQSRAAKYPAPAPMTASRIGSWTAGMRMPPSARSMAMLKPKAELNAT